MTKRRKPKAEFHIATTPAIAREVRELGVDQGFLPEVRELDPTRQNMLICNRVMTPLGPIVPAALSRVDRCLRCNREVWASWSAPHDIRALCTVCFGRIGGKLPWET